MAGTREVTVERRKSRLIETPKGVVISRTKVERETKEVPERHFRRRLATVGQVTERGVPGPVHAFLERFTRGPR